MSTEPNTPQPPAPAVTPPPALPPVAPPPVQRRSPGVAVVLSFLPGLGHLYLGLYQRGIAFFVAFVAGIALAEHADEVGVVVAFVWFFTLIDAYRQTQFINTGVAPEPLPAPNATVRGNLGLGVFLLIAGLVLLFNEFYPIDFYFLREWWPMILVLVGAWLVSKHFLEEQKKRREALQSEDSAYRV